MKRDQETDSLLAIGVCIQPHLGLNGLSSACSSRIAPQILRAGRAIGICTQLLVLSVPQKPSELPGPRGVPSLTLKSVRGFEVGYAGGPSMSVLEVCFSSVLDEVSGMRWSLPPCYVIGPLSCDISTPESRSLSGFW